MSVAAESATGFFEFEGAQQIIAALQKMVAKSTKPALKSVDKDRH